MKIAILMSGQMRTLDVCADSFRRCVLDPMSAEADVTVYCAAAADEDAHKAYEHLPAGSRISIDEQPTLDEANYLLRSGKGVCGVQSVLKQFWSWLRVWELAQGDDFDFAVRVRGDAMYYNPVESSTSWKKNTLYVPRFSSFWGVCDRFGYGDREIMRKYHTILERLPEFMDAGAAFHPESLVIRATDCAIERTNVLFSTVRNTGEVRPPQFLREIGDVPLSA